MALKTALLVVDMQKFFESMTTTALPNIKKLITHFEKTSAPIIFTQHGHSKEELTADPPRNQLVRKWGPSGSIATGSNDWQFQDELKKYTDGAKVVAKNTYDAFINTDLQQVLDEDKIQRVVVCGVMTDCCCDTTARSAFNRGFETWLVSDACGSANKAQHQAGLKGFGFAFGEVVTTKEAIGMLEGGQ
ncbi:hypothetical protein H2198_001616 [Neophaeococcomyces mojaviensis]|uniref:Uncharacterized protein n=1 Tax=Neophaeococcomyces mojaviensis TaxID=3383035 RepID=A0ACC3AGJ5_9EURO|nr:hypothetical protein H2198_001616 [Knufia sp. JES_112]